MRPTAKTMKLGVSAARHSNRPGCKGKVMYRNEGEATHAVAKYKAQFPDDSTVRYYKCQSCGEYHIGHDKPDPAKLEVEAAGRFLVHEGLTYAKIADPNKLATFWLFVVPPGTPEDEGAVLEKGVLVAYKLYRDIWREKGDKRSDYHQVFFLCPTMNYVGAYINFLSRIEWHKEHMGDLMQTKMDLLNGLSIAAKLGDVATVDLEEMIVTETQKAQLVAEQEMYKGRAVFRTKEGRPYHRSYRKCFIEGCGCEIELRAYISRDRNGAMTNVQGWLPVDSLAVSRPRPRSDAKRTLDWVCGTCVGKVSGEKAPPPVEAAPPAAPPPAAEPNSNEPPIGYLESCSYCGLPGHWRADCPEIAVMVKRERQVQREKQAYGWNPPATVVRNLQKIAQDRAVTADFVRGATLLACHLLAPQNGELRL